MNAFERKAANYIFYGHTQSLCETCLDVVPAKVIIEGEKVFLQKRCREHGVQKALISTDVDYYKLCHQYLKPGDRPQQYQMPIKYGCPHDCGLCPDHEQHTCLALIEVNEACNLDCPVCFASSGTHKDKHRSLEEIGHMMDTLVASEVEPDLLQISGGEPTLHPQILEIIAMAKERPIRHIMLNTNGIRIAKEPEFAAQLAQFKPGFEVYLQFDTLQVAVSKALRGADLTRIKRQALENLERHNISTTLVAAMKKGVNEHEVGDIINHALSWNCVRGVTFQPIQDVGRNDHFESKNDRMVLSDIRRAIIEADNAFDTDDMIPLPCNPESISIGYALRNGKKIAPITSLIPQELIVAEAPNAVTFEKHPAFQKRMFEFFSLANTPDQNTEKLNALLCCLPEVEAPKGFGYDNIFRIAIVEFLDAHNFCLGRVKRSCVHFITPDGKIIPFDTYNLFYRDGQIEEIRRRLDG